MRILHVLESLTGGGGSVSPWEFAAAAHTPDIEEHEFLSLGAVSSNFVETSPHLKVEQLGRRSYGAIGRWIAHAGFDLVHVHWWERMPFLEELAAIDTPPVVVTCDVYPGSREFRLSRREISLAQTVVFDGRDAYDAYPEIPSSKKRWIVGSSRLDGYLEPGRPQVANGRLRIGRGSVLNRYKCPVDLIAEVAEVLALVPEGEFHIYGHGPLRRRMARQIREAGLQDRVFLDGWVDDFPAAIRSLDVYLYHLPMHSFASSELNLQGAAAAGLPIILLPSEGTRWMFRHEEDALVACTATEAAQFAKRLAMNPSERERLGHAARTRAVREWGLERMIDDYRTLVYGPIRSAPLWRYAPFRPRVLVQPRVTASRLRRLSRRAWRRARDLVA